MADCDSSVGGVCNICIEESPLISDNASSKSCIVHMGSECRHTVIAKESVATDRNRRIVVNLQRVRNSCGSASRTGLRGNGSVHEAVGIVVVQ